MPNSSGGQQEGEEEEVGEFWQQDEERVVKRRITVSRRPTSRMTSITFRLNLQKKFESYSVPVKVNTITEASEKRMLRQVAFTEKVISTSPCESFLPEQHFVLDSNEKKVKVGKSKKEG